MRKVTLGTTCWLRLRLASFSVSVGYAAFFCPDLRQVLEYGWQINGSFQKGQPLLLAETDSCGCLPDKVASNAVVFE
jgi:hypothetical protein